MKATGGTSTPTINPLAAINQEAYDAEYHDTLNLGLAALTERVRTLTGDLDAAVREAGDDFNVEKIKALKGDTPEDTLGRVVDHHSRLSAAQEQLNQRRSIMAAAARRAARDGADPEANLDAYLDPDTYRPRVQRPVSVADAVRAVMTEQGMGGYVAAHRANAGFELDLDPRIYAQMTRGSPGDAPNQWDSAASPPWSDVSGPTVMLGRAALSMIDIIPSGTIGQAQHIYYREMSPSTGLTSNATHTVDASRASSSAAARAEGAALAATTFQDIRVADTVESIGHRAKVTMEQLEDSTRMQGILDTRMPFGVRQQLNRELLNGSGTSPRIKGFLAFKFDNSGSNDGAKAKNISETFSRVTIDASDTDTNAKAGKSVMLQTRRAMTTLMTEGASMASAVVMHPETCEHVQLTETTAAGFYYGDPRLMPAKMLWGLPIVEDQYGLVAMNSSTAASMSVALIGDFAQQSELLYRHGIRVEFGMSSDDFDKLIQSVRAYVRAVLSIYRLKSFVTIETVS